MKALYVLLLCSLFLVTELSRADIGAGSSSQFTTDVKAHPVGSAVYDFPAGALVKGPFDFLYGFRAVGSSAIDIEPYYTGTDGNGNQTVLQAVYRGGSPCRVRMNGFDLKRLVLPIVSGDFNGDGITDMAAFYDDIDGVTLHVWRGQGFSSCVPIANQGGDGSVNGLYHSRGWSSAGYFAKAIAGRIVAGDFNGDGLTDIAAVYRYSGSETKIHTFLSVGNGFAYSGSEGWWTSNGYSVDNVGTRVVAGKFSGDDRADLAMFYDYGNGKGRVHVFTSTGQSFEYSGNEGWWGSEGSFDMNKITGRIVVARLSSGNQDDIAAIYDGGIGSVFHYFAVSGTRFNHYSLEGIAAISTLPLTSANRFRELDGRLFMLPSAAKLRRLVAVTPGHLLQWDLPYTYTDKKLGSIPGVTIDTFTAYVTSPGRQPIYTCRTNYLTDRIYTIDRDVVMSPQACVYTNFNGSGYQLTPATFQFYVDSAQSPGSVPLVRCPYGKTQVQLRLNGCPSNPGAGFIVGYVKPGFSI